MSTNCPLSYENFTFTSLDRENLMKALNHVKAANISLDQLQDRTKVPFPVTTFKKKGGRIVRKKL